MLRKRDPGPGPDQPDAAVHSILEPANSLRPRADPATALPQADLLGAKERRRPKSVVLHKPVHFEQKANDVDSAQSRTASGPHSANALSAPRSAGLKRTYSIRDPGISVPPGQNTTTRMHARTQSSSVTSSNQKEPAEPRPRSERPRSLLVSNPGKVAADVASSEVQNSARIPSLKRSVSSRSTREATARVQSRGPAVHPDSDQHGITTVVRRREPAKEEVRIQGRPAFSTLQQHFTPKKAGKAPTSSFLQSATSEAGQNALSSDVVNLQAELVQLHVLHATSAQTSKLWELSAQRSLHRRFDEVASLYQGLCETERQGQEQKNVEALRTWCSGDSSLGLMGHMQVLSGPLHELPSLLDAGGRFERIADEFDDWIAQMERIWLMRSEGAGGSFDSTESLGDSWKAESAALTRKLTTFWRNLEDLNPPTPGSSIASIVATCQELLGLLLEELQSMQKIETSVVAKEKEWVEASLEAVGRDTGPHVGVWHGGNMAWRT
ncbi:hypothetical protein EJ04DRAFT_423045 [Polyplosphaeria fusca]|uniref:Uncharacterized protein n=1 Tax=Polyplosphaeria fusca TaxID=682080 RepID=A0A9P4RDR3_9PLEO|nr:hypothetical protein EJ04DRAFT_423045 [Polyplosphaeria fusca]